MHSIVKICKATLLFLLNIAALYAGLVIALYPGKAGRLSAGAAGMRIWARTACAILGIRVRTSGLFLAPKGALIAANHSSYLDILVLGSLVPGAFVAKKDVASWFLIGPLAKLAGTVFVDRASRMSTGITMEEIDNRLASGISVMLFPEGTTNNGRDILAFKSSFFKIPVERNCTVFPASIVYDRVNGSVANFLPEDIVPWHGDMHLLPHFWNILGMQSIAVNVRWNPPINHITTLDASQARKQLAAYVRESVRSGFSDQLAKQRTC